MNIGAIIEIVFGTVLTSLLISLIKDIKITKKLSICNAKGRMVDIVERAKVKKYTTEPERENFYEHYDDYCKAGHNGYIKRLESEYKNIEVK